MGLSLRLLGERGQPNDISRGGMRIYADDAPAKGARLELELFLPTGKSVTCHVEVVWVEPLADGAPARFDVGLRFMDITDEDRARLGDVLDEA